MRNIFESFFSAQTPEIEKIKLAQENAIEADEFRIINAKITAYEIKLHKNQISPNELADYEQLKKEIEASSVISTSPEELVSILKCFGIEKSKAEETARHELSHVQKAEENGGTCDGYICTFFKDSKSPTGYGVHVSVNIIIPENLAQSERDEILRDVLGAPEELGRMSQGDKEILSNI